MRDDGPPGPGLRLLLRAYPRDFRARHGADLVRFLRAQRREERYRAPLVGAARYWVEVGWDTLRSAVRAHANRGDGRGRWRMVGTGVVTGAWRQSWRGLRRSPGFVVAVTLTLGLGIGAATAIFSLANWTLLRPVPGMRHHDRLVTVRFQSLRNPAGWFLVSHPDFLDLQAGTHALEGLAATHPNDVHLLLPGAAAPRRVAAELVTGGYFRVLGADPAPGRAAVVDGTGDARIVVVSRRLWRESLGADPGALGSTVRVNGVPFTIVGVAPEGFLGPSFPQSATDLWMPVEAHRDLIPAYPADVLTRRRSTLYFTLYGLLREGATPETVQRELTAAREAVVAALPGASSLDRFAPVVEAGVGIAPWFRGRLDVTMEILLAVVGVLLLLGCANAGNLLLARASSRLHEAGVRRALGARGVHVVVHHVAEGILLALVGGAVGVALAAAFLHVLEGQRILPNFLTVQDVPLDGRVLAFALGVSVLTGAVFAAAPALVLARSRDAAPGPGRRATAPRSRLRSSLVVAQVALSLALVVGAGLLVDTMRALHSVDLGFRPRGVLEATLDPGTQGYGDEESAVFWSELVDGAEALPGVSAAGLAWSPLHGHIAADTEVRPAGGEQDQAVRAGSNYVSRGFIGAVGMELIRGRDFLPAEVRADPPRDVVIVSESLARDLFGTGPAVGRRVSLAFVEDRSFEVVGVVADARVRGIKDDTPGLLLEPLAQEWVPSWATLYVRTSDPPGRAARRLQELVRRMDGGLPLYDVQTLEHRVASSVSEERMLTRLTTLFAGLALLLASVGLGGLMMYSVVSRTRELGLRITLGAPASHVRRLVLKQALATMGVGLPLGLLLAAGLARLVEDRLWGVEALDPVVFGGAALVLTASAVAASWLPAWRATRVDPVRALATEA